MLINNYDSKALKILFKYNPTKPGETSEEEFKYAKDLGLMFDSVVMNHDGCVDLVVREFKNTKRDGVANSFIIGLSRNFPVARAAFSAFSVMAQFPAHGFHKKTVESLVCEVCGMSPTVNANLSFINRCRWTGGLVGTPSPVVLGFYLQRHNIEMANEIPSDGDIDKFCEILDFIKGCPAEEKPLTLAKKIRKIPGIKMTVEEARHFIDSLGYAGILQTPEHIGFIYKYHGYLTPSSSRSSDWAYPVDFWRGSDGINKDALNYWFSHHKRLCCTSRKADEITPAPDAAMPWHPRAPCSGARVA